MQYQKLILNDEIASYDTSLRMTPITAAHPLSVHLKASVPDLCIGLAYNDKILASAKMGCHWSHDPQHFVLENSLGKPYVCDASVQPVTRNDVDVIINTIPHVNPFDSIPVHDRQPLTGWGLYGMQCPGASSSSSYLSRLVHGMWIGLTFNQTSSSPPSPSGMMRIYLFSESFRKSIAGDVLGPIANMSLSSM